VKDKEFNKLVSGIREVGAIRRGERRPSRTFDFKPDQVPVPDWHRQVIRQRLADHVASPLEGRPWEKVRDKIRNQLERRKSQG